MIELPITRWIQPKQFGELSGVCAVCGRRTEQGFKLKLPNTFTDWPYLQTRPDEKVVICEYCNEFLTNPELRRKSWILKQGEIKFISRKEAKEIILNPPDEPYTLYVTKSGKKHGWLSILYAVNTSKDIITIGWEDEVISASQEWFISLFELFEKAISMKAKKRQLEVLSPRLLLTLDEEIYEKLKNYRNSNERAYIFALSVV